MSNDDKIIFQGKVIEIFEYTTPNAVGKKVTFEKGRRAPGTRLIIQTPDGEFLITKEKRIEIGLDYRLPGGKVFDSIAEYNSFLKIAKNKEEFLDKVKEAAIKEGVEEVGIKALDLNLFHISHCGATFEWDLYYFVVKKYEEVGQMLGDDEDIEVLKVSAEKLKEIALSGQMQEDRSVGVIVRYLNAL